VPRLTGTALQSLHSLGKLEDVLIQIAGITGKEEISIEKRALLTFCADNGVVEENVTQSGQEVTATVAENFLQEKATAAILCRGAHADLFPIDIGMARDTKVPRYKVAYGTKNMAKGPAMTREEAVRALETGIAVAEEKIAAGDNRRELIEQYTNLEHLTREIVETLIDYISVGKRIPGTRDVPIEIHWNF
jgi:NaMN:DMB phosphoribosyltransferase